MIYNSEYPESFLRRLNGVGSPDITPENSEKYWIEHKANMTWGVQKALNECECPCEVAILGAGKCSDIRLLEIMQKGSVRDVDLYDLDLDSVNTAINYVKSRINSIMPEAVNFANFNPVFADVTFVMKKLLKKFDGIRYDFTCEDAQYGPEREKLIYDAALKAMSQVLSGRKKPEKQYDTVVSDCLLSQIIAEIEIQLERLRKDLLSDSQTAENLWEELEEKAQELFIKDHFDILAGITKPGGSVFMASDNKLLLRGKVNRAHLQMILRMQKRRELPKEERIRDFGHDYIIEEIETPRFKYMDGNMLEIAKKHMPDFDIVGERNWEWNRDPHEIQKRDTIFRAEKVQGVVLKRK